MYKEILNDEVVSEKIGLVAGSGDLPAEIIEFCDKHKVEVYCALLKSFAKTENFTNRHTAEFHIGHIGKIIKYFKKNKITKLVFAGGVKKPSIFSLGCDFTGFLLLKQIFKNKVFGDNTTLETIIKFVEKKGFIVGSVHDYVENSKFICGFNGKTSFNDNKFFDDIELGKQILGSLSSLDIGQAVIIQQGNAIGIECIEGTQKLIERSKDLLFKDGRGAFLLKIKKTGQTNKADLPSIGSDTILQLKNAGLIGLVVDSENCIAIRKKEIIKLADENGLFIYGI